VRGLQPFRGGLSYGEAEDVDMQALWHVPARCRGESLRLGGMRQAKVAPEARG
jgi:hypothetical protein